MINDLAFMAEFKRLAVGARYLTSVCTGSLVLGAAGLLKGNGYPLHCPLGTWYACLVDTTRHPVAGLDYPRTFQAMDERFRDDAACREYIRRLRWPQEFTCPHCGEAGEPWVMAGGWLRVSGLPQTDIADRRDDLRGYP